MKFKSILTAAALVLAVASCTEKNGPMGGPQTPAEEAYVGQMNCNDNQVDLTVKVQPNAGYATATIAIPSFEIPGMGGKKMAMPALTIKDAKCVKDDKGIITYEVAGPVEIDVNGTIYKVLNFVGSNVRSADGKSTRLTLEYGVQPGKMPFPLPHHFEGVCTFPSKN